MRILVWIFGLLALAAFGTSVWASAVAGMVGPFAAYDNMEGGAKLIVVLLLVPVLLVILVLGWVHRRSAASGRSVVLTILMWLSLALGALASLHDLMMIWMAVQMTHTTNFKVVAPGLSSALLPLAFGLLTATLAAALNLRKR
jgi:hypothetical protein